MKRKLIVLMLFTLLFLMGVNCKKEELENNECSFVGEKVEKQQGVLLYTNLLNGQKIGQEAYYIIPSENTLPLKVCNVNFLSNILNINEQIKVIYSGSIEVLPETVDAVSVNINLTYIQRQ